MEGGKLVYYVGQAIKEKGKLYFIICIRMGKLQEGVLLYLYRNMGEAGQGVFCFV